jgi:hypothetical protein
VAELRRRNPITAPPATPARYSLLTAAGANGVSGGTDWQIGVTWLPESCGGSHLSKASEAVQAERTPGARTEAVHSSPFYVWAEDNATATPVTQRDWQGRARRRLEATQSFQIARELWTGAFTTSTETADERSPFLADTTQVADVQASGQTAIGIAEALAMEQSEGRRIMIHVPIPVLEDTMADGSYVMRDTGGVLTTAMGSIVVADAGYDGSAPELYDGASDGMWVYTSTLVQVRLDAIELLPASLANALGIAQALGRPRNDMMVLAQRLALYVLDPCARIAVSTDVPVLPDLTTLT